MANILIVEDERKCRRSLSNICSVADISVLRLMME